MAAAGCLFRGFGLVVHASHASKCALCHWSMRSRPLGRSFASVAILKRRGSNISLRYLSCIKARHIGSTPLLVVSTRVSIPVRSTFVLLTVDAPPIVLAMVVIVFPPLSCIIVVAVLVSSKSTIPAIPILVIVPIPLPAILPLRAATWSVIGDSRALLALIVRLVIVVAPVVGADIRSAITGKMSHLMASIAARKRQPCDRDGHTSSTSCRVAVGRRPDVLDSLWRGALVARLATIEALFGRVCLKLIFVKVPRLAQETDHFSIDSVNSSGHRCRRRFWGLRLLFFPCIALGRGGQLTTFVGVLLVRADTSLIVVRVRVQRQELLCSELSRGHAPWSPLSGRSLKGLVECQRRPNAPFAVPRQKPERGDGNGSPAGAKCVPGPPREAYSPPGLLHSEHRCALPRALMTAQARPLPAAAHRHARERLNDVM
eukprot:scaffold4163_cov425-Prasinococcus_capsulatus_cf.AAC.7